jgi:hypothetical protein
MRLPAATSRKRRDLVETPEGRHGRACLIVTNPLPVKHWHMCIGEANQAGVILDGQKSTAVGIDPCLWALGCLCGGNGIVCQAGPCDTASVDNGVVAVEDAEIVLFESNHECARFDGVFFI